MSSQPPSLIELVENERRDNGLTQAEVADACNLTQGHYSKLARAAHRPSRRVTEALTSWLDARGKPSTRDRESVRIASLIASIQKDCVELVRLVGHRRDHVDDEHPVGRALGRADASD